MEKASNEPKGRTSRVRIAVGEPWSSEDLAIDENGSVNDAAASVTKRRVIVGFAVLFGSMVPAYAAYGMIRHDGNILSEVWSITTYGLAVVGAWAIGTSAIRAILSKVQPGP